MSLFAPIADGTLAGVARSYAANTLAAAPLGEATTESPESSVAAEVQNLIASLGQLAAQAQALPLSPPTLPALPQNAGYQPHATDYMQLADDQS